MYGTITFDTLQELAEFLGHFSGKCTAVFKVHYSKDQWIMEFEGGY